MSSAFSHLDADNNPSMVDVGAKAISKRIATARAIVYVPSAVMLQLQSGDLNTKKGPVFQTAILAGIMGSKRTSDLIPLCHPIGLDKCQVEIKIIDENRIQIDCTTQIDGKTGVEMEALVAATTAALTIYDMCKAMSHDIIIEQVKLMAKHGGKRDFERPE